MFDLQIPPEVHTPPAAEAVASRPAWDLTAGLIAATVQIDQRIGDGATRRVGTAFLVDAPGPDRLPRTVLVTAAHVLEGMASPEARIGWRFQEAGRGWRFAPEPLSIRDRQDIPRWTRHPERDVAVMTVAAPPEFARAAIPLGWLAGPTVLEAWQVGPGDELMTLGYPHGYSANKAGFPILRTGRIASWPLTPISEFPTFLLDFAVFPGNSGGPVFWTPAARRPPGTAQPEHPFVAGVLVQEMRVGGEPVGIGIVAHAEYIREAIALMDGLQP
jgi:S1-C subfamily serine protease